ncbi:MAG TPA: nucleotide exchange factor GrpE [Bacteroidales bacterium]|nr:nucleotide exchange factor GrpE [Bacteroidales bacterium]HOG56800.1 nucleotide exchange factor GrpE [Bacteroidales bacterium]
MVKKRKIQDGEDKDITHPETSEDKDNTKVHDTEAAEASKQGVEEEPKAGQSEPETAAREEADKRKDEDRVMLEKLAEMQDKYLRLSAEFDNYRKRTLKEKMDISKYAGEEIMKDILPIIDDFDRALKHMESSPDCEGIKEGIDLIYNKFIDYLKRQGIKEIESLNEVFNVDIHDAAAKVQVEEEERKGKVVEVLLKGYYLKDKVLRHSKVVIGE